MRSPGIISPRERNSVKPEHFIRRNHTPTTELASTRGGNKEARLTLLYKVANGEVIINASNKLLPPDRLSRHTNAHSFQLTSCKTSISKEYFYQLETGITSDRSSSLGSFKRLLLRINFKSDVFICTS